MINITPGLALFALITGLLQGALVFSIWTMLGKIGYLMLYEMHLMGSIPNLTLSLGETYNMEYIGGPLLIVAAIVLFIGFKIHNFFYNLSEITSGIFEAFKELHKEIKREKAIQWDK